MTVLSQIQSRVVLKQIKDGVKATLDSFASIYVLDPSPAKMREFSPLSETLKADGSNVAGVIAALPEEETADFEDRLTKHVSKLPEKDIRKVWAERVGRFGTLQCFIAAKTGATLKTLWKSMLALCLTGHSAS